MNLCIFLFVIYFQREAFASSNNLVNSAEETFEFVNSARAKLNLTKNPNIILVIGNTGSGKSTLVHYVTGDYSKLVSIEPTGYQIEYQIHDGLDPDIQKDFISTTVSRTIIPGMAIDETNNVWYDCPGFEDTRNSTIEIATTYLTKSVIENVKNVKVVLLAPHESVTIGHDRHDFDHALDHVATLLKDIRLFVDSVALVITKVPPYHMHGQIATELTDEVVKNSTASFLIGHRIVLVKNGAQEKKIQLIDAILRQKTGEDYPRISIFWRPPESGPFNSIDKMVKGRQNIRHSIVEYTSYANVQQNDFGFPLTAETRMNIESMVRHIFSDVSAILAKIDGQLLQGLRHQLEWFTVARPIILTFSDNNNVTTLVQYTDQYKEWISSYDITSIDKNDFHRIIQHESNFYILRKISEIEIDLPIRISS